MADIQPLDARLRGIYPATGFSPFPFKAFDDYGQIILPEDVHFPDEQMKEIDQALTAPLWKKIYAALSKLDDGDWNCYSAAVNYQGEAIDLIIAKSIDSLPGGITAGKWCESLGNAMLYTVQEAAGTQWLVDHQLVNGLRAILNAVKTQLSDANGGTAPVEPGGNNTPPKGLPTKAPFDVSALTPVMGLQVLVALADFALTATKPRNVTATVIWYVPETWPTEQTDEILKNWYNVGHANEFWDHTRRVSSCVWNPEFREVKAWTDDQHWKRWSPPMPLTPTQLSQFFYPIGKQAMMASAQG